VNQLAPLKYIFYIGAPPVKVWQAIVGEEDVRNLFFDTHLESTVEPGSDFRYVGSDGKGGEVNYVTGKVLECTPERRITMLSNYQPNNPEVFTTRSTYELEPVVACTKLTLTHDEIREGDPFYQHLSDGTWKLLSRLKSMIETGEPLNLFG